MICLLFCPALLLTGAFLTESWSSMTRIRLDLLVSESETQPSKEMFHFPGKLEQWEERKVIYNLVMSLSQISAVNSNLGCKTNVFYDNISVKLIISGSLF